jgi:predicted metal-dependent hydrolase
MLRTASGIEYELRKTCRKDMEMRVLSRGEVRVFVPERTTLKQADAFVASRADWIRNARAQMGEYARQRKEKHPMTNGASVLFEGRPVPLIVERGVGQRVALMDGVLRVTAPDMDEEQIRLQVRRFLTDAASQKIGERLNYFAPLIGRSPGGVAIRDQKTRWGSCSSLKNLNFNWKLIMAPPEALDYVVIHELCHLYEFNHSPKFWERVRRWQPDYEAWKRWLKDNGRILGV